MTNINDARLQNIRRLNKNGRISINLGCANPLAFSPIIAYGVDALLEAKSQYESLVADRMPWDFKHKINDYLGPGITLCSTTGCDPNIEFSVPGNIHFGFVSREAGYSGVVTHIGAGYAEIDDPVHRKDPSDPDYRPYDGKFGLAVGMLGLSLNVGDNPLDHQAVQFGIHLYNSYGHGLTLGQFRQELSGYMNRLDHKLPTGRPVQKWIADQWPYRVGFFEPEPPSP